MPTVNISIEINKAIYLRDPSQTTLGKKIVKHAIELFDVIGFEEFNFKKLAKRISSTEASVYRYFENKHRLLSYIVAWYWDYMHVLVYMDTRNSVDPADKLRRAVSTLVNAIDTDMTPDYIDQVILHRVVVENATKVHHIKSVDTLNEDGHYSNYKKIVQAFADMITAVDATYRYPVALASSLIDQSLNNEYYLEHLPSLTDPISSTNSPRQETSMMMEYLLERLLTPS